MRNLREIAEHGRADLIEKLVQSEEELNQHDNGHHALWYAARAGQVVFIQKLLKFAHAKGWQIIEEPSAVANDLTLDLAVRANNFFCVQALALHLPAPSDIFSFKGAYIHKLNQIPLTVIALTKEAGRRKSLLDRAFLEAMKYPGTYENLLRIELLLELGANPHITSFDSKNFTCPLTLCAGRYSASASVDPSKKSLLSLLLTSLNSRTINLHREVYESSIRKFFEVEVKLQQELRRLAKKPKKGIQRYNERVGEIVWGSGGGFLHWVAAMGHSEILGDVIESFYAHNSPSRMFCPDEYGNTPLTCALLGGYKDIAKRLVVEELRQVSLKGRMWLNNEKDQVYLLNFLDSKEIKANFKTYQTSLNEFFRSARARGASLLHWAAFSGHAEIIPCIIECFRTHGIPLHHANMDKQTPLDLAREENHEEIVQILESTKKVKIQKFEHVPDLRTKLLREYQKKILDGKMTIAEFKKITLPDMLGKLEELKPHVSMMELLNPRFYEQEGKTPLMVLCEQNRVDLVERLLPFLTNNEIGERDLEGGNTALHLACTAGALDIILFFQKHRPTLLRYTKNNSGLIPILCVGLPERKIIFKKDTSGTFLDTFIKELESNFRTLLRREQEVAFQNNMGLFGISALNVSKLPLRSIDYSVKIDALISLLIELLEKDPVKNAPLLYEINNNAALRAALNLSQKNLANDSARADYCSLVLRRLRDLDLELKCPALVWGSRSNKI